ncbi:hypothetical protein DL96DRAFT_1623029 [Flagelloscypha sp. PMI_526]|nr:hypothetical protein DL96DRAFT_1623029 [Flagelloscypha sp. PMI_526]
MSPAPAPASSSSTTATRPSVGFVFPSSGQEKLCDKLFIEWFYHGPADDSNAINLYITNEGLTLNNSTSSSAPSSTIHLSTGTSSATTTGRTRSGSDVFPASSTSSAASLLVTGIKGDSFSGDVPRRSLERRSMTVLLAKDLPAASGNITWNRIAVPPGIYVIAASFPKSEYTYTMRSLPFLVNNSDDTTCLGLTPTTTIEKGTPTAASAGGSSKSHAGSIAGGVIGGLAAIAALIACLLYLRYKNRNKRRATTTRFADNTRNRPWGRLGNVDLIPGMGGNSNNGNDQWRDRKPRPRSFSQDVKSPTAFNFGDISPTQRDGPETVSSTNVAAAASPTFIRAPPASHDPFADGAPTTPGHQNPFLGGGDQDAAYPSGVSDALPNEDVAAIRGHAQGEDPNSPTSASPLRQQRKPVPDYMPSPPMRAVDHHDDNAAPSKASSASGMHYILPDPPQPSL